MTSFTTFNIFNNKKIQSLISILTIMLTMLCSLNDLNYYTIPHLVVNAMNNNIIDHNLDGNNTNTVGILQEGRLQEQDEVNQNHQQVRNSNFILFRPFTMLYQKLKTVLQTMCKHRLQRQHQPFLITNNVNKSNLTIYIYKSNGDKIILQNKDPSIMTINDIKGEIVKQCEDKINKLQLRLIYKSFELENNFLTLDKSIYNISNNQLLNLTLIKVSEVDIPVGYKFGYCDIQDYNINVDLLNDTVYNIRQKIDQLNIDTLPFNQQRINIYQYREQIQQYQQDQVSQTPQIMLTEEEEEEIFNQQQQDQTPSTPQINDSETEYDQMLFTEFLEKFNVKLTSGLKIEIWNID